MNVLFINRFYRTKEDSKELFRYLYFGRTSQIIFYTLFAILFLLNLFSVIFRNTSSFFLFFAPLYCGLQYFIYKRSVSVSVNRDLENFGGAPFIHAEVTQDALTYYANGGRPIVLPFTQVKHAIHTTNLICLWSKSNQLYMLRKDSFGAPGFQEFLHFLNYIHIKVK